MRFNAFGVDLVIDELEDEEFSSELPRKEIRFITTLLNIDLSKLPNNVPKIYTSEAFKLQLMLLYLSREEPLSDANFHVLKPFETELIKVDDDVSFEVLPCMSADASTSFMLAFRKVETSRITHLYAGFVMDLSTIMVNTQFANWLKASGDSVDNLYQLSIRHDRCVDCEFERAFDDIQEKLADENIAKLLVHLPLFGCEAFIAELASRYRGIVAIDGLLNDLYSVVPTAEMQHFTKDFEDAVIVISRNNLPLAPDCAYQVLVQTFKVKWLPLPDAFELKLFTRLVNPKSTKFINYNIKESFLIHMVKYSYQDGEIAAGSNTNPTTSPKVNLCHCLQMSKPLEMSSVKHASLDDCMQHLVFKYTDQYQNIQPVLTVEDELEQMFNTPPPAANNENQVEKSTALTLPNVPSRNNQELQRTRNQLRSEPTSKATKGISIEEQPTTSKAAQEKNRNIRSDVIRQSPKTKNTTSIPSAPIVYHHGKRGLRFEDNSSSSD